MKIIEQHKPCPMDGCDSSNAYCKYEDGHGYCFSCGQYHPPESTEGTTSGHPFDTFTMYVPHRGLTEATLRKYDIRTHHTPDGTAVHDEFIYGEGRLYRSLEQKQFWTNKKLNNDSPLFGQDVFAPNSAKTITISEGAYDAAAIYQMLGSKYPSVSIRSAASGKKECIANLDYLNSFDQIVLCLDGDKPGQKAALDIVPLFDRHKISVVTLTKHKDANDYLEAGDKEDFYSEWWNAESYKPEHLVSSFSEIEEVLNQKEGDILVEYPFYSLQTKTFGIREGEVILLSGLEGLGKTEVIRAIEYHTLTNSDHNLGIIHLEESQSRNVKGLVGYHLQKPVHLPDNEITLEKTMDSFKDLCGRDERVFFYNYYASGEDTVDEFLSTVRFLVTSCDCKIIFFDHITMLATGSNDDDERRLLDKLSTNLALMVDELNFALVMISHINDNGLTRGSRNISKIADLHIQLNRDLSAENPEERNLTFLNIVKNRFSGQTGYLQPLHFNPDTFTLQEVLIHE